MMYWWHDGWGWGWADWLGMALMMVAFWGLLVLAVVVAVRWWRQSSAGPATPPPGPPPEPPVRDPRRILDERLASGDLSPDEYRERRELLEQT